MKPHGEKFLSEDELKEKTKEWQAQAKDKEGADFYKYVADRIETGEFGDNRRTIDSIHQVSFLDEIIPGLIEKKKGKVRILDLGTGTAAFPEQIRKKFGDQVEVFSTGLSKRIARNARKHQLYPNLNKKLHKNDLKWRSVSELSDYPEFDLILDSFGEGHYSVDNAWQNQGREAGIKAFERYLEFIAKKLLPDGIASIGPVEGIKAGLGEDYEAFRADLENRLGIQIYPVEARFEPLWIRKLKKDEK